MSNRLKMKCHTLSGFLSIGTKYEYDIYNGDYKITPAVNKEQILKTNNKVMTDDVVVAKVPYFETSNDSNGKTAYIGKDV